MNSSILFLFSSHPWWLQQKNSWVFLHPWKWCLSHRLFFFNPWYQMAAAAAALQRLALKISNNQKAACPSSSHIPKLPRTLRTCPLRGWDLPGWGWAQCQSMTSDRGGTAVATDPTAPPAHSRRCRLLSSPSPTLKQLTTSHSQLRVRIVLSPCWQEPGLCPPTQMNSGLRLTTERVLTNIAPQSKIANCNVSVIPTTSSTNLDCWGSRCAQSSWSRKISAPKASCSSFRSKQVCCWRLWAAETPSSGLNCSFLCSTQKRSSGELKLRESWSNILMDMASSSQSEVHKVIYWIWKCISQISTTKAFFV